MLQKLSSCDAVRTVRSIANGQCSALKAPQRTSQALPSLQPAEMCRQAPLPPCRHRG